MEQKRWPDGVQCPHCQEDERIGTRKGGYYRCNACMEVFTVRTKTVMERSHISLHKWIYGMSKLGTARKGISSVQLAKELGIRQASAWFMLQRLREACRTPNDPLRGIVEMDETFIGGFEGNKHESKKLKAGRGPVGKTPVIGMRERTSPDSVRKGPRHCLDTGRHRPQPYPPCGFSRMSSRDRSFIPTTTAAIPDSTDCSTTITRSNTVRRSLLTAMCTPTA